MLRRVAAAGGERLVAAARDAYRQQVQYLLAETRTQTRAISTTWSSPRTPFRETIARLRPSYLLLTRWTCCDGSL